MSFGYRWGNKLGDINSYNNQNIFNYKKTADDLSARIREVEAELEFFIYNLTKTDQELRDGIKEFRANMIAQKVYTMEKLENFRDQEYFTDNQTLAEIKVQEDELNRLIGNIQGELRIEMKRYNENMDKMYKENLAMKEQDDDFTRQVYG